MAIMYNVCRVKAVLHWFNVERVRVIERVLFLHDSEKKNPDPIINILYMCIYHIRR